MIVEAKGDIHKHKHDGFLHLKISPKRKYQVIGITNEYYRIMNDDGEPCMYPKTLFIILEKKLPEDWILIQYDEENSYIGPKEFSKPGFFEDYFDGREYALKRFKEIYKQQTM